MMQLPQTIVMDLGEGSQTLASEFSLGADIRIAAENSKIAFNHCQYGLVPAAGGMSMLSTLVSPALARAWVLSGAALSQEAMQSSGFIKNTYDSSNRNEVISDVLTNIAKLAPVQRIQAKLGLFESLRTQFENGLVMDRKISKASMMSEDWRSKKPEAKETEFMPAKSMSYSVKLSLIKNEDGPTIEH